MQDMRERPGSRVAFGSRGAQGGAGCAPGVSVPRPSTPRRAARTARPRRRRGSGRGSRVRACAHATRRSGSGTSSALSLVSAPRRDGLSAHRILAEGNDPAETHDTVWSRSVTGASRSPGHVGGGAGGLAVVVAVVPVVVVVGLRVVVLLPGPVVVGGPVVEGNWPVVRVRPVTSGKPDPSPTVLAVVGTVGGSGGLVGSASTVSGTSTVVVTRHGTAPPHCDDWLAGPPITSAATTPIPAAPIAATPRAQRRRSTGSSPAASNWRR